MNISKKMISLILSGSLMVCTISSHLDYFLIPEEPVKLLVLKEVKDKNK